MAADGVNNIRIETADVSLVADVTTLHSLVDQINHQYQLTEGNLWKAGDQFKRTTPQEVAEYCRLGQLIVAWVPGDCVPVGSVCITAVHSPKKKQSDVDDNQNGEKKVQGEESIDGPKQENCENLASSSSSSLPVWAELGMLAVRPEFEGNKIGTLLIEGAVSWTMKAGISYLGAELLRPRGWKHEYKERLLAWYQRLGFRIAEEAAMEERFPHLVETFGLAGPSNLTILLKAV